eukprot:7367559-Pyramimonas_sp.AAC.1
MHGHVRHERLRVAYLVILRKLVRPVFASVLPGLHADIKPLVSRSATDWRVQFSSRIFTGAAYPCRALPVRRRSECASRRIIR